MRNRRFLLSTIALIWGGISTAQSSPYWECLPICPPYYCLETACEISQPKASQPTRKKLVESGQPAVKPVQQRRFHKQAGLTSEQKKRVDGNCYAGIPKLDNDWNHGITHMVYRDGYVLQHSAVDRIPLWVAEGIVAQQLEGRSPRRNRFAPDPLLPETSRAELADYKGSGYDRGHMAPAGNQTTDQRLKDETFFLSNMSPQIGTLNQQSWQMLESKCQEWTKAFGHSYILTGGMFYDPEEEDPATADGQIDYKTIGNNKVAVPTHFYKIFIYESSDGKPQAVAFVMENRGYQKSVDHSTLCQSIDWIEERTGINFMPDLSPSEERRLERNVNLMPDR